MFHVSVFLFIPLNSKLFHISANTRHRHLVNLKVALAAKPDDQKGLGIIGVVLFGLCVSAEIARALFDLAAPLVDVGDSPDGRLEPLDHVPGFVRVRLAPVTHCLGMAWKAVA